MGRPRTPIGTYGAIRHYEVASGWKAETLFRDSDGVNRKVSKVARSKTAAERALKEELAKRQHRTNAGLLDGDSKFSEAADQWLAEITRKRKGTTADNYRKLLSKRVRPAFAERSLRECDDIPVLHRFLRSLEDDAKLSPNTARGCRTVLSGVMEHAAKHGAIPRNPVRDVPRIEGGAKPARALMPDEWTDLLAKADGDKQAGELDLPDLIRYSLGVGTRIGETLGLRWVRVDLNERLAVHGDNLVVIANICDACGEGARRHHDGWCPKGGTVWTTNGRPKGLVLQSPKTEAGYRILPLPDFVSIMLEVRYPGKENRHWPVFPNAFMKWRDPNNTSKQLRHFLDAAGYPWVTSHTFRKTAITIMDRQGLSARSIAGYAGHTHVSMTQDKYMDRRPQDREVADALDRAMRKSLS